jgi:DDE superfamily endonuclease
MIMTIFPAMMMTSSFLQLLLVVLVDCCSQIIWENRWHNYNGNRATVCVDGIHFKVNEPAPFSSAWCSHKYKGSALAYELVSCINTGWIVAFNGPFPAGQWNDLKIFRNKTKDMLFDAEWALGDLGYRGEAKVMTKEHSNSPKHGYSMGCARDRHETINRRLRNWRALHDSWRHDIHLHHLVFQAVMVIEQIKFQNGSPPFQVTNYIDPLTF